MQGEFEEPGFPGMSGKGMVVLLLTNKGANVLSQSCTVKGGGAGCVDMKCPSSLGDLCPLGLRDPNLSSS